MARIVVTVVGKGVRQAGVDKIVQKLKDDLGESVSVSVRKEELPESRSQRYAAAQSLVEEGKSEMETLRDELQERLDNMPENLQGGSKASEIEDAIGQLDEAVEAAEAAADVDVSFPGMF